MAAHHAAVVEIEHRVEHAEQHQIENQSTHQRQPRLGAELVEPGKTHEDTPGLLPAGLAADIAPQLTTQAAAGDRVVLIVRQVRVLPGAGQLVMSQMAAGVRLHVVEGRWCGEPFANEIVELAGIEHGAVTALVHDDTKAELASAEQDNAQQDRQRVCPDCHDGEQHGGNPIVAEHEPPPAQVAALKDAVVLLGGKNVFDVNVNGALECEC